MNHRIFRSAFNSGPGAPGTACAAAAPVQMLRGRAPAGELT